jgi:Flp pilus assembly protein TadD
MSVTRPLIAAFGTAIFLAGCATTDNLITEEGLLKPEHTSVVETENAAPGESFSSHQHQPIVNHPADQKTQSWQLGEPDLIVKLPMAYSLPLEGADVFRSFVIPNVTVSDRYVHALDFRLDNHEVVHHAEFRLDESDTSWQRSQEEPESGFEGMNSTTAHYPEGHFVNWVPGKRTSKLPEGLAWRLPAKADLVVQLHMMPSGFKEVIDPEIALYFVDKPPVLSSQMVWLGSRWLPIAAGDPSFITRDSYELPSDVEVMNILPHCHYICKGIKAWATLPDGSSQRLVKIEEWDFYKQDEFRFKPPLNLPRGTILSVEFSYDNSADNRRNPNDPPQNIEFGPMSSNEMADLWVQVMPKSERESVDLRHGVAHHLGKKIIESLEQQVKLKPNVNGHIELARYYRSMGQLSEAVTQLQRALELAPANTTVLENLAIALTDVGQRAEALIHWKRHVQLAPNDLQARVNLATALGFSNQVVEAESHLKRATELDPNFGLAFFKLGRVQSYLGRFDDALRSFRAALALDPNEPAVLHAVARLLATHPDPSKRRPEEALELANRALKHLPRPDSMSLSTLAMAQAATSDFELAVTTASLALSRVTSAEENLLTPIIQRQIDHYQQGRIEVARAVGGKRFIAPGERNTNRLPGL